FGEASPELDRLPANRRRDPSAKSNQKADERDDDQRRADPAWYAPTRQVIHSARYGETKEDSEKRREKERTREPKQPHGDVHGDDQSRRAQHVLATPPYRPSAPLPVDNGGR